MTTESATLEYKASYTMCGTGTLNALSEGQPSISQSSLL